jgi:hypothetical protein
MVLLVGLQKSGDRTGSVTFFTRLLGPTCAAGSVEWRETQIECYKTARVARLGGSRFVTLFALS